MLIRKARDRSKTYHNINSQQLTLIGFAIAVLCLATQVSMAQVIDPLCDPVVMPLTKNNGEAGRLKVAEFSTERFIETQMLTFDGAVHVSSEWMGPPMAIEWMHATQTVEPTTTEWVTSAGKKIPVKQQDIAMGECAAAITHFKKRAKKSVDTEYYCALLAVDKLCLTNSEEQPHIEDSSIPQSAVAIIVVNQSAKCTGLLLNDKMLRTARHCFIDQESGAVRTPFNSQNIKDVIIETLDGMRRITINPEEVEKLIIKDGFEIKDDPVTIAVTIVVKQGARPLPKIIFKAATEKDQLLWLVGPVFMLDQAVAKRKALIDAVESITPDWHDGIRWSSSLGAQCRTVQIEQTCIFHSCQSFPGFSGSPMITSAVIGKEGKPNTITFTGVHSGSPGLYKPDGWPNCAPSRAGFQASQFIGYPEFLVDKMPKM